DRIALEYNARELVHAANIFVRMAEERLSVPGSFDKPKILARRDSVKEACAVLWEYAPVILSMNEENRTSNPSHPIDGMTAVELNLMHYFRRSKHDECCRPGDDFRNASKRRDVMQSG